MSDSDASPRHSFGFNSVFTQSFEFGFVLSVSIISSFAINHNVHRIVELKHILIPDNQALYFTDKKTQTQSH